MENLTTPTKTIDGPAAETAPQRPKKSYFFRNLLGRGWADLLDLLVFYGGLFIFIDVTEELFFYYVSLTNPEAVNEAQPDWFMAVQLVLVFSWTIACTLFRDAWGGGRSVGKRFCHFRIYTLNTNKPGVIHSVLRQLTVFLPSAGLLVLYAFNPEFQGEEYVHYACWALILLEAFLALLGVRRLGDYLAGTKIVFSRQDGGKSFGRGGRNGNGSGGNGGSGSNGGNGNGNGRSNGGYRRYQRRGNN